MAKHANSSRLFQLALDDVIQSRSNDVSSFTSKLEKEMFQKQCKFKNKNVEGCTPSFVSNEIPFLSENLKRSNSLSLKLNQTNSQNILKQCDLKPPQLLRDDTLLQNEDWGIFPQENYNFASLHDSVDCQLVSHMERYRPKTDYNCLMSNNETPVHATENYCDSSDYDLPISSYEKNKSKSDQHFDNCKSVDFTSYSAEIFCESNEVYEISDHFENALLPHKLTHFDDGTHFPEEDSMENRTRQWIMMNDNIKTTLPSPKHCGFLNSGLVIVPTSSNCDMNVYSFESKYGNFGEELNSSNKTLGQKPAKICASSVTAFKSQTKTNYDRENMPPFQSFTDNNTRAISQGCNFNKSVLGNSERTRKKSLNLINNKDKRIDKLVAKQHSIASANIFPVDYLDELINIGISPENSTDKLDFLENDTLLEANFNSLNLTCDTNINSEKAANEVQFSQPRSVLDLKILNSHTLNSNYWFNQTYNQTNTDIFPLQGNYIPGPVSRAESLGTKFIDNPKKSEVDLIEILMSSESSKEDPTKILKPTESSKADSTENLKATQSSLKSFELSDGFDISTNQTFFDTVDNFNFENRDEEIFNPTNDLSCSSSVSNSFRPEFALNFTKRSNDVFISSELHFDNSKGKISSQFSGMKGGSMKVKEFTKIKSESIDSGLGFAPEDNLTDSLLGVSSACLEEESKISSFIHNEQSELVSFIEKRINNDCKENYPISLQLQNHQVDDFLEYEKKRINDLIDQFIGI